LPNKQAIEPIEHGPIESYSNRNEKYKIYDLHEAHLRLDNTVKHLFLQLARLPIGRFSVRKRAGLLLGDNGGDAGGNAQE